MSNTAINCHNICCQSGHRFLLKNINWQVKEGEHWVVFGMNGSGKTTLLSLIAGFKVQTSGSVKIFGEEYGNNNVLKLRKKIGWVSGSFFDKFFSQETSLNIVLSGVCGTFCPDDSITDEDVIKAKELLRQLNLGDKFDRQYKTLSKGEQQSVLIARSLIGEPDILVLDEPGTGLDVQARESMLQLVKDLAEHTSVTIIYVTHYPEEILELFDHCLLLRHGRIFKIGPTEELMSSETLSSFLEKPIHVEKYKGKLQVATTPDGLPRS